MFGLLVSLIVVLSMGPFSSQTATPVALQHLTVPPAQLPDECVLVSPAPLRLSGGQIRVNTLSALGIPTNPWIGSDRATLATIRERMDGHAPVPDAPLTSSEYARFRMRMADDAEEGYVAAYQHPTGSVMVYAARLNAVPKDGLFFPAARRNPRALRFTFDRIVVVVEGNRTPCYEAVEKHLASLAN